MKRSRESHDQTTQSVSLVLLAPVPRSLIRSCGGPYAVELGALFQVGDSLWRVLIPHFSPWDCNLPFRFPPEAEGPQTSPPPPRPAPECTATGSRIGIESRSLGESVDVVGAPFSIEYQS